MFETECNIIIKQSVCHHQEQTLYYLMRWNSVVYTLRKRVEGKFINNIFINNIWFVKDKKED